MSTKEKKVFSIKNFRGLDKENKLLKVADFRASDGENFIIDSETLKTRPAITHKDTLPFDIEVSDEFVASYKFREVEIFITKNHIYIYDGNSVVNEKNSNIEAPTIGQLNFEGKEPLFREEKDCLFIFNVGYIYVFSILRKPDSKIYKYVLYPLSAKPSNPFLVTEHYYKQFEDLPLPYEPTIFIGDNRYEDMNLLSNVTKYKLFASNRDAKDGQTTYMLPTVYERAKHGSYGFDISFYQNKFAEHGIYPIFLGRKGEDIDEKEVDIADNYGATLNEDGIEIEDVFFPKEDFVFTVTVEHDDITTLSNPTKVSDIVGVTKEWFFKAKVREDNKPVFTYILNYINDHQTLVVEPLIDGNKTLKFSLPIKYNAVYEDISNGRVVARKVEETNIDIYVQLKFYSVDQTLFTKKESDSSDKITVYDLDDPSYPEYPDIDIEEPFTEIELQPISSPNFTNATFENIVNSYLRRNQEEYEDGEALKIKARLYDGSNNIQEQRVTVNGQESWIYREKSNIINKETRVSKISKVYNPTTNNAFPDYPYVPGTFREIDLFEGPQEVVNLDQAYFESLCEDYILENENNFENGEKVKLRAQFKVPYNEETEESITPEDYTLWKYATFPKMVRHNEYLSSKTNVLPSNTEYPEYPPGGSTADIVIDLPDNPKLKTGYTKDDFIADCQAYINENPDEFTDGQLVKFRGRYYETSTIETGGVVANVSPYNPDWLISEEDNNISFGDIDSIVDYPYYQPEQDEEVVYVGLLSQSGQEFNYASTTLHNQIKNAILADIPNFQGMSGNGVAYVKLQTYWDDSYGNFHEKGVAFIVPFEWTKVHVASESRQSMISLVEIQRNLYGKEDITLNAPATFPAYPTFSNPNGYQDLDYGIIHTADVENVDFSNPTLLSKLETAISDNIADITANSGYIFAKFKVQTSYNGGANVKGYSVVARVEFQKYSKVPYENRQSMIMTLGIERVIHIKEIDIGDPSSYPDYPTFDNTSPFQPLDLGIVYTGTNQFIASTFNSVDLYNEIESKILENINTFESNSGNAFARIRVQNSYNDGTKIINTGASLVVGFNFQKYVSEPYQDRQSFVMTTVVDKTQQMAEDGVYEHYFDDKEKAFVVKVRDYFFDYNDEPSIEVKITFKNNPDYKMISDCKFGTTFGSENRLFLAGNPNYPNIDRYNVSNDLLGDNIKNQSYELTYFPSKNYRVLGGRGAINGYVVATDSHLYVTKENYPNDEKLFIRERILDENGVVGYHEYKTSVKKSPLNNKCIVRFYNDILILSEDGLHGVEISSNVLTDERLIKPRDGFIKRDLVNAIKNYDHSKIFMVENDVYLYIFIGDDIYVADSRYLAKNEDGEVGNFSYEIVKWKAPTTYLGAKIEERYLELIQYDGKALYHLEDGKDYDDLVVRHNDLLSLYTIQGMDKNAFILPETHMYIKDNPQDYVFKLKQGFKVIGVEGVDYHIDEDNGMVVIKNSLAFRNISDGENVYFKENKENDENDFVSIEVLGYNEDGLGFPYTAQLDLDLSKIYMNIAELPLKVSLVFEFNDTTFFRLTPFTPSEVPFIKQENMETTEKYLERLDTYLVDNQDYIFTTVGPQDCYINKPTLIQTRWVGGVTDLKNNLMEKTMFRVNIYATRPSKGGSLVFGYKTMGKAEYLMKDFDVANQNSLEALNFNHFGFSSFSELGASSPLKESNFLYIQFQIVGTGSTLR